MMTFAEYLRQPCDTEGCDYIATHNQYRADGRKFCNQHTDFTLDCHARDD